MAPFTSTSLKSDGKTLWVLDQTQLPQREVWLESASPDSMIEMIRDLKLRGAPLIGVAAAYQLARFVEQGATAEKFERALWALREARPTAVNLMNALDRIFRCYKERGLKEVMSEAEHIALDEVRHCEQLAAHGSLLIRDGDRVLTLCNTGALSTVGIGTALGLVTQAARQGKSVHVYVSETRPLLQGARLTAWECGKNGIPFTLLCDSASAYLMQKGKVDRVIVGADRIARNGDFAGRIGTYDLAVLCKFHSVPFCVVAPQTSVDVNCAHGGDIPVEERAADEVRGASGAFGRVEWAYQKASVWNPAVDVTPESLVSAWVLDRGVFTREEVRKGALVP
jgi:methylthioribose-1-phosphate isomerase